MFIVLEGADGTGKTTLCSALAEKLGATAYATPPKKYMGIRTRVDKEASAEEHYRFYRDGIYDASDEIRDLLHGGGKVVCDRYWLTTYTYHQIMGVPVLSTDFDNVVIPTLTVLLTLNHEVQIGRILRRAMSVGDRRVLDKQCDIALAYYRNALDLNLPFLALDTQYFSTEACVEIVARALE